MLKFLTELYRSKHIILKLAQRDFKIKYARNYFGLAWAVIEPLAMLMIMLVVFTYLRNRSHSEYPFIVYLLSGVVGFNFFSAALGQATHSIKAFSFIINIVHLRISFVPFISILSTFFTHLIVLGIAIFILLLNGIGFSWYWFQLIYFMLASWLLLVGLTWFTSALVVYVRDLQYLIRIGMRAMFFLTPIFWDVKMFPEQYQHYLKLNPLYYIVEGYRMSLLYHQPFWSDGFAMVSFWMFTLFFLFAGAYVFKRLSPTFIDLT